MSRYSPRSTHSSCTACLHELGIDARVVVMGSSGVGKTSLIRRYTQNAFEEPSHGGPSANTPTTAPSFVTKKAHVGRTKVRLQLWDTPGQLHFRTMAPMYYRDADAALLLYDTNTPSTFDSIRVWLEALKNTAPHILVYVVGIKNLKADTNASSTGFNHNQITPELARWLVSSWFPPVKPTTAAPPPSPATRRIARFASYFRFPFRSLSMSSAPPAAAPSESTQRTRPRVISTCTPSPTRSHSQSIQSPAFSASSMMRQNGARFTSLTQMRRTQSEVLPQREPTAHCTLDSISAKSKSMYHSRSVSSLVSLRNAAASEHGSTPGPNDIVESDADEEFSNSLPNKIEFFECALKDKFGIDGLFQQLLTSITDKAHTEACGDATSDLVSISSRGSSPSPPSTPLSRSVLYPCYPPSEEKETQNQDDYYTPEASPGWRAF
ncbi:hypothetical protein BDN71DRAFT_1506577 [Pleurotus eryngii]|uniref:Uncharacterized protein n=1 Tax=Pleurotus eryngii TaxID=5323 RepID=A0A9P5ZXT9_PLEER|nr:hypothetical protein BDN71DRAFT_1506577 [Pleurotus eryngii]